MKRFRLRFSIRTLVIVVTLACCYAACCGPTKRRAEDVTRAANRTIVAAANRNTDPNPQWRSLGIGRSVPVVPLIVASPQFTWEAGQPFCKTRHYYFWFFGYVAKLPYERELPLLTDAEGFWEKKSASPQL